MQLRLKRLKSLYQSLISSVISLAFGQLRAHSIYFYYRTTVRQKVIYSFSSLMNTICNFLILVSWQTAIVDYTMGGVQENAEDEFGVFTLEILVIAFLLLTPFLYVYMVLPTSKENFMTTSIDCPHFYKEMSLQCFSISFFLFLTSFVNSYVHEWSPEQKLELEILLQISQEMKNI